MNSYRHLEELPDILTAEMLESFLSLSKRRIYELMDINPSAGGIPCFRIGRSKRVLKTDLSVRAIENWRKDGTITPCKGIPAIRFSEQHIFELEGVKLDRMSPLERKKLELKNEKLQIENKNLKEIISKILAEASQVISM